MNPKHTMIKGPHCLFTGANGHKTYGITLRNGHSTREECAAHGVAYEWSLNDRTVAPVEEAEGIATLAKAFSLVVDLTEEEAERVIRELIRLRAAQE